MLVMSESKEVRAMRQRRGEIVDEARAITNKGATISPADQKKFDALMNESDQLAAAIKRANSVDVLGRELATPLNNRRAGLENGLPADRDASTWIDTKTGAPIRVLNKGEKLADLYPDFGGPKPRASLGDAVKAMISPSSVAPDIRAAVHESSSVAGGYLVPDSLSAQIIDNLRAESVCFRAGARVVPMPTADVNLAKLTGDPQGTWRVENQTLSEDSPTFGRLRLSARSLAVIVKLSREIVEDANVDEVLRNSLAKSFALSLDNALLYGAGVSDPLGIVNWSGIGSVSLGTDGAQISGYDSFLDAVYEAHVDNAGDFSAAVMHPRTEKTISKFKDGAGLPLRRPQAIESLPFLTTTQIPIDETQGISSDCSSIICGDFTQMLVGMRTELQIQMLRERYADAMQIGILAYLRADMVLANSESFVRIVGVKP